LGPIGDIQQNAEIAWPEPFIRGIILSYYPRKGIIMSQLKVGDHVSVRGLFHSDCLGMTGTILEIKQSALFGPRVQRCKVHFNGKIRHFLSVHLAATAKADSVSTVAA
jgi:hypothetical protein